MGKCLVQSAKTSFVQAAWNFLTLDANATNNSKMRMYKKVWSNVQDVNSGFKLKIVRKTLYIADVGYNFVKDASARIANVISRIDFDHIYF